MSQTAKPNQKAGPDAGQTTETSAGKASGKTDGVDIAALEETVGEVVETLDVTVQAAEFVQARSPNPAERARAADIQQQAEAMLDAAKEAVPKPPRLRGRTMH